MFHCRNIFEIGQHLAKVWYLFMADHHVDILTMGNCKRSLALISDIQGGSVNTNLNIQARPKSKTPTFVHIFTKY